MNCYEIEELLSLYIENSLTPEEKQKVENHLRDCSGCRSLLSSLNEVTETLHGFPEFEMKPQTLESLHRISMKKRKFQSFSEFLLRPAFQPVLAVATVFFILLSFYTFHPNKPEINMAIEKHFHNGYSSIEKLFTDVESFGDSLNGYKENLLDSLKNIPVFQGSKDNKS